MVVPGNSPVLEWFEAHGRNLPWRRSREPWSILVSELMLQQTQVIRVVERWPRFLARFPDPESCAKAAVGDVLDEWSGLGYNRRAVNLHRAATIMVAEHCGAVPRELAALLSLPGIGPYTARAVRIFAFEEVDAVVDTNVARILARTHGRSLTASEAQRAADRLVPPDRAWAWNQALLDIGATLCRAKDAVCGHCPLRRGCLWASAGTPPPDPALGSAGVAGRQSRFEGSDRQGRGRLVRALRDGPIVRTELGGVMGWPDDTARVERVLRDLLADGLVVHDGERVALPS